MTKCFVVVTILMLSPLGCRERYETPVDADSKNRSLQKMENALCNDYALHVGLSPLWRPSNAEYGGWLKVRATGVLPEPLPEIGYTWEVDWDENGTWTPWNFPTRCVYFDAHISVGTCGKEHRTNRFLVRTTVTYRGETTTPPRLVANNDDINCETPIGINDYGCDGAENGYTLGVFTYSVTILPGAGGTTSPPPGSYLWVPNECLTVIAIPNPSRGFERWGGSVSSTSNPLTMTVDGVISSFGSGFGSNENFLGSDSC
jgi:hypothetical protein